MQNSQMMQGNRMMETSRMYNCFCVHPNGTVLRNSRNVTARSREDAPDCETMGELLEAKWLTNVSVQ